MRNKIALAALLTVIGAAPALAAVTVSDAWIRALPVSSPSGGYFTLHNDGKTAETLVGAASPACGMLMLHQSENKGGMSAMHEVTGVDVAPGGTLRFEPGSYHLMCMGAKPILQPGAEVPVTLTFKSGETLTANFVVRNAAGK
jgi:periplasmic copper chaperone A